MRALVLLALSASCNHMGSSTTAADAILMSSVALAASAANRAAGGCYAVCQQGETCNPKTGLCEALPCRGQCLPSESCEEGFFGIKCLPAPPLIVTSPVNMPPPPPPPDDEPKRP